jgi:integrase
MARKINRLSPAGVRNARPGMHADGGGLWLQVSEGEGDTLRRSWIFRFASGGRERKMGLGSFNTISLAEARQKAANCRKLRQEGLDPIEHRDAQKRAAAVASAKSITFEKAAERYMAAHRAGWRNVKHASQWKNTLDTYVVPVLGKVPVSAVDVALVMQVLEPIWTEKPETAGRVRGRIEAVLDWATAHKFRQEGLNPARWRGHLDKLLPNRSKVRHVRHHPALPYAEMGDFMAALRLQDGTAARALEFAILTAARTGEVIGARWEEFDLEVGLWTVPEERMKSGKVHRAPLSNAALGLLQAMHNLRRGPHVFPGDRQDKPLSTMALLMVLRRMSRGDLTAHGFRSTFRDWAAECTSFPREVCELALAHAIGDKVEAAYRRGDLLSQRRKLTEAWAVYCAAPKADRVIAFGRLMVDRDAG